MDDMGLRTSCVYSVPCGCSQVYTGQTGRSIETRVKEHQWHILVEHSNKSAVAVHSISLYQRIQLQDTNILSTKSRYTDRMTREVIDIELHSKNMDKEDGRLSRSGSLSSTP
jgi:hypothetical protein